MLYFTPYLTGLVCGHVCWVDSAGVSICVIFFNSTAFQGGVLYQVAVVLADMPCSEDVGVVGMAWKIGHGTYDARMDRNCEGFRECKKQRGRFQRMQCGSGGQYSPHYLLRLLYYITEI